MKTQNNNQGTVISKVGKMVLFSSAVIFSAVLISMTASGQNFWKQFSNTNANSKMAFLMVDQSSENKNTNALFEIINAEVSTLLNNSNESFAYEPEMEKEMEVESWMTEESLFNSNVDFNAIEAEENLRIEDWMIDTKNFSSTVISETVDMENPMEIETWMTIEDVFNSTEVIMSAEPSLEVEVWMTDEAIFSDEASLIADETDKTLNVEDWMTSETNFNKLAILMTTETGPTLEIENWMTNENFFKTAKFITTNEADQECTKYAQKLIKIESIRASK